MLIRPILDADLPAVRVVYRHCVDFLFLGNNLKGSLKMIAGEWEVSAQEGGEYMGQYLTHWNCH